MLKLYQFYWLFKTSRNIVKHSDQVRDRRIGHKSLSLFVRYTPKSQSVCDPGSAVAKATCLRLSILHESK